MVLSANYTALHWPYTSTLPYYLYYYGNHGTDKRPYFFRRNDPKSDEQSFDKPHLVGVSVGDGDRFSNALFGVALHLQIFRMGKLDLFDLLPGRRRLDKRYLSDYGDTQGGTIHIPDT